MEKPYILELPPELLSTISELLPTNDLRNFRKISKYLSAIGYTELEDRVPDRIWSPIWEGGSLKTLCSKVVCDLQCLLPRAAAKVRTMNVQLRERIEWPPDFNTTTGLPFACTCNRHPARHEPLGSILGHVRLASLSSLNLEKITTDPWALETIVISHRHTLSSLYLTNVYLDTHGPLPNRREQMERWMYILLLIRSNLFQLRCLRVEEVSWILNCRSMAAWLETGVSHNTNSGWLTEDTCTLNGPGGVIGQYGLRRCGVSAGGGAVAAAIDTFVAKVRAYHPEQVKREELARAYADSTRISC